MLLERLNTEASSITQLLTSGNGYLHDAKEHERPACNPAFVPHKSQQLLRTQTTILCEECHEIFSLI
jgi:hypothetical protein